MPFVIAQIRQGAKVLKSWYARCVVPGNSTIADLFRQFSDGSLDNGDPIDDSASTSCVQCSVGGGKTVDKTSVSPDSPVDDTVSALGQYVELLCQALLFLPVTT